MRHTQFIVMTDTLARALRMQVIGIAAEFRHVQGGKSQGHIAVGGEVVTMEFRDFTDFDLPYPKVVNLLAILDRLSEQPITIAHSEDSITISEIHI